MTEQQGTFAIRSAACIQHMKTPYHQHMCTLYATRSFLKTQNDWQNGSGQRQQFSAAVCKGKSAFTGNCNIRLCYHKDRMITSVLGQTAAHCN